LAAIEPAAAEARAALNSAPPMRFSDQAGLWGPLADGPSSELLNRLAEST